MTKRVDLTKRGGEWVARTGSGQTYAKGRTKAEAVANTATTARSDRDDVSVRIHLQNGRIQEERTYPRSADPRRSRG